MSVTFELAVPSRPLLNPPFEHPQGGRLENGADRRHRELLQALDALGEEIADQPVPEATPVVVAPVVPALDPQALAAALASVLVPLLDEQTARTTKALDAVVDRIRRLGGAIAAGSGPSGVSGISNDQYQTGVAQIIAALDTTAVAEDLTVASGTVSPGSPLTVTPSSAGNSLRVWWISILGDPDNSSTGTCTVSLDGKGTLYQLPAMSHRQRFDGAVDGALTFTADDGTFGVTVHYQEITP